MKENRKPSLQEGEDMMELNMEDDSVSKLPDDAVSFFCKVWQSPLDGSWKKKIILKNKTPAEIKSIMEKIRGD